jgi:polysaccharide deacetylase family protein (PEP-CTERM system associated)
VISFTVDLEDPTGVYAPDGRYIALTRRILDLCAATRRRATFFTIGRVAEACPELICEIAKRGHEVAYHSHNHVSLTDETPECFMRETRTDKDRFEQLTGKPIIGFRAPRFSLTPDSLWATDVLAELGFRYSSSIMPTGVSLYGFADAPTRPFRWANGLIELPLPVVQVGPLRLPYLGGIYLYALPGFLPHYWVGKAGNDEILWTYTHPYDLDREEKFAVMPDTAAWVSMILWLARCRAEPKLRRILAGPAALPLGERIDGLTSLETYS